MKVNDPPFQLTLPPESFLSTEVPLNVTYRPVRLFPLAYFTAALLTVPRFDDDGTPWERIERPWIAGFSNPLDIALKLPVGTYRAKVATDRELAGETSFTVRANDAGARWIRVDLR